MIKYILLSALLLGVDCTSVSFITPCKAGDTSCIKSSAQAAVPVFALGIPELGVKSLDPMHLDRVVSKQAGLSLTFEDSTVTGMKGCTIEAIKHDLSKGKQVMTVKCSVDMTGNYNISGQLLIFPIRGQGKYNINIRDIIIKTTTDVLTVDGDDGQKHWHVGNWKFNYLVKTNAHFNFENLFNGNRILAEPVENFLNTNWREVMTEVAEPIVRAIVTQVVEAVEALYKAVPSDQLEIV